MRPELFKQFDGRRVLLTGHTGFKGSWLALWLRRLGAEVVGVAEAPPTDPSHFEVASVESQMKASIIGDIRNYEWLADIVAESKPDLVMHLAAQSVVKTGYEDPLLTFSTNVMGTANVLEAVRQTKRRCAVLVVASDKCYENVEQIWGYRECDALGGREPYGASKGAAELVVETYRNSYFPKDRLADHGVWLASVRAGNVIGGGDWTSNALIADTIKSIMKQEVVRIRSPFAVRPWQHVLQCLGGYLTLSANLLLAKNPQMCSGWNIGPNPGNELTVAQVVDRFIEHWGSGEWQDCSHPSHPREAGILRLSIDKALAHLGWQPCWDVDTTLQKTVEWYRRYSESPSQMHQFSVAQIDEFQSRMFEVGRSSYQCSNF